MNSRIFHLNVNLTFRRLFWINNKWKSCCRTQNQWWSTVHMTTSNKGKISSTASIISDFVSFSRFAVMEHPIRSQAIAWNLPFLLLKGHPTYILSSLSVTHWKHVQIVSTKFLSTCAIHISVHPHNPYPWGSVSQKHFWLRAFQQLSYLNPTAGQHALCW